MLISIYLFLLLLVAAGNGADARIVGQPRELLDDAMTTSSSCEHCPIEVDYFYSELCCNNNNTITPTMCSLCDSFGLVNQAETIIAFDDVTCANLESNTSTYLLDGTMFCDTLKANYASWCCNDDSDDDDHSSIQNDIENCPSFSPVNIEYQTGSTTDTVSNVETLIELGSCTAIIGDLNVPDIVTVTIAPVEDDTSSVAVYEKPAGMIKAKVVNQFSGGTSLKLEYDMRSTVTSSHTSEAGVLVEIPKSQLQTVNLSGLNEHVQILDGFQSPRLTITDHGSQNIFQATFTTSSPMVVEYTVSGIGSSSKIDVSNNDVQLDIFVDGSDSELEVKGDVNTCRLSGIGNNVIIEGGVLTPISDGSGNVLYVNHDDDGTCGSFVDMGIGNTCASTDQTVALNNFPCTYYSNNLVCVLCWWTLCCCG